METRGASAWLDGGWGTGGPIQVCRPAGSRGPPQPACQRCGAGPASGPRPEPAPHHGQQVLGRGGDDGAEGAHQHVRDLQALRCVGVARGGCRGSQGSTSCKLGPPALRGLRQHFVAASQQSRPQWQRRGGESSAARPCLVPRPALQNIECQRCCRSPWWSPRWRQRCRPGRRRAPAGPPARWPPCCGDAVVGRRWQWQWQRRE